MRPMPIVIAALTVFLMGVAARAQVIVDYDSLPPTTESALFDGSVVILRGRIEAREMHTPNQGPQSSVYHVRILELLKTDNQISVGGIIDVHRHGGFEKKNADLAFPAFQVNDEVVLFLEQGRNGWYWPLYGPDGAFKLTKDGRTHAYGHLGEVSTRHAGRSAGEFLADLRKHKK